MVNAVAVHLLSYGRTWKVALRHIYQCLFAFFVFVYLILNFGPYP